MAKDDLETGRGNSSQLYPMMRESPELRWAFIRKIYVILSLQFLMTVAVASVVVFIPQIPHFVAKTTPGLAIFIVTLILPFLILCALHAFQKKHPVNLILLMLFTITISFAVGLSCAFTKGRVVLEAVILTSAMVIGLTLYTFWAVKRGKDFSFLGPFLFGALLILMIFSLIQIIFPLGKITTMIYGCIASLIFCGYIVYDTDNLIKRYTYDEYIWAAVSLYLDIINLFLALLEILRAAD